MSSPKSPTTPTGTNTARPPYLSLEGVLDPRLVEDQWRHDRGAMTGDQPAQSAHSRTRSDVETGSQATEAGPTDNGPATDARRRDGRGLSLLLTEHTHGRRRNNPTSSVGDRATVVAEAWAQAGRQGPVGDEVNPRPAYESRHSNPGGHGSAAAQGPGYQTPYGTSSGSMEGGSMQGSSMQSAMVWNDGPPNTASPPYAHSFQGQGQGQAGAGWGVTPLSHQVSPAQSYQPPNTWWSHEQGSYPPQPHGQQMAAAGMPVQRTEGFQAFPQAASSYESPPRAPMYPSAPEPQGYDSRTQVPQTSNYQGYGSPPREYGYPAPPGLYGYDSRAQAPLGSHASEAFGYDSRPQAPPAYQPAEPFGFDSRPRAHPGQQAADPRGFPFDRPPRPAANSRATLGGGVANTPVGPGPAAGQQIAYPRGFPFDRPPRRTASSRATPGGGGANTPVGPGPAAGQNMAPRARAAPMSPWAGSPSRSRLDDLAAVAAGLGGTQGGGLYGTTPLRGGPTPVQQSDDTSTATPSPSRAVPGSGPSVHWSWEKITIGTAKCDYCPDGRRRSVLQRCTICSKQCCKECWEKKRCAPDKRTASNGGFYFTCKHIMYDVMDWSKNSKNPRSGGRRKRRGGGRGGRGGRGG